MVAGVGNGSTEPGDPRESIALAVPALRGPLITLHFRMLTLRAKGESGAESDGTQPL